MDISGKKTPTTVSPQTNEFNPNDQESEGSDSMPSQDNSNDTSKGMRTITTLLLIAIAVLLAAIAALLAVGSRSESSMLQKDKPQAVHLNNGQVYFGRLQAINSRYMVMTQAQNLQPDCTLTEEKPKLVLNRASVAVWENLEDEDHISRAITEIRNSAEASGQCLSSAAITEDQTQEQPEPTDEQDSTSTLDGSDDEDTTDDQTDTDTGTEPDSPTTNE